mgnify:CR=1 FL=1
MLSEPGGPDQAALEGLLRAEYGLTLPDLRRGPQGADSVAYLGEAEGRPYFVKAHDRRRPANFGDLEQALGVVRHLGEQCRLACVPAVLTGASGRLLQPLGDFAVAVFEYVSGPTLHEAPLDAAGQAALAQVLARLHQGAGCPGLRVPAEAPFPQVYAQPLQRILAAADDLARTGTDDQRRLSALLRRERTDLLQTLDRLDALGRELRAVAPPVLTHGEPTARNVLRAPAGRLVLVDWGEVALGLPERDLTYFADQDLGPFLEAYAAAWPEPPRLSAAAFGYYAYRWAVSEVIDYGLRLLLETPSAVEVAWAWSELPDYLPLPHAGIRASQAEVAAELRRLA